MAGRDDGLQVEIGCCDDMVRACLEGYVLILGTRAWLHNDLMGAFGVFGECLTYCPWCGEVLTNTI